MEHDLMLKTIESILNDEPEFDLRALQGLSAPGRPLTQPVENENYSAPIFHNGTHILVNATYAYPIPPDTNYTAGNFTYVWTPTFASTEVDECKDCSCCIGGECRPANECGDIQDTVLILCIVALSFFLALGFGACWFWNRMDQKRRKEHPELYE